ncbi:MAG: T9SS type A sorting domain-containing protein [bacterium]
MKKYIVTIIFLGLFTYESYAQANGTWVVASTIPSSELVIVDSSTLLAYFDPVLLRSDDGGYTWSKHQFIAPPNFSLNKVTASTRTNYYSYDNNSIFQTQDGGDSWSLAHVFNDTIDNTSFAFKMLSEKDGFVLFKDLSSNKRHLLVTNDGCHSFTSIMEDSMFKSISGKDSNFAAFDMTWIDPLNGAVFIPTIHTPHNKILITHDGGANWKIITMKTPTGDSIIKLEQPVYYGGGAFLSTYSFLSNGDHPFFYYSTDRGDNWEFTDSSDLTTNILTLGQSGPTTFWGSARQSKSELFSAPRNVMLHTNDLGKHWTVDRVAIKDYDVSFISFSDSNHGFAQSYKIGKNSDSVYLLKFIKTNSIVNVAGTSDQNDLIKIYPNPCQERIQISNLYNVASLVVTNMLGQRVFVSTKKMNDPYEINTSKFEAGRYNVDCFTDDGTKVQKSFVKLTP